jgi:hypothetical protein
MKHRQTQNVAAFFVKLRGLRLPQRKIARSHVSVEFVLALAIFMEGPEKATV